jgi:hypothetical protein
MAAGFQKCNFSRHLGFFVKNYPQNDASQMQREDHYRYFAAPPAFTK